MSETKIINMDELKEWGRKETSEEIFWKDEFKNGISHALNVIISGRFDTATVQDSLELAVKALEGCLLFINKDGSPCDGFRFRELMLEGQNALEEIKRRGINVVHDENA